MAEKIAILQLENKPSYMVYFESEKQLKEMPFNELIAIVESNNLRSVFDEIKKHRRRLRGRDYSMMSREKKLKELSSLEKCKEYLLSEQNELEVEIKELKETLSKEEIN